MRLLLIEDEGKVAAALREGLEIEGFALVHERNGDDGLRRATAEQFDLLLLDLGLPGRSGIDVLRSLREKGINTRAIILTARDAVDDRVQGLDAGADDYLVKPFAFAELLARIRALLRRNGARQARFQVADLQVDLVGRKAARGGQPVDLTVREFELLAYLMQRNGEVVTRESLARDVWQERERSLPLDNVIDVHVARLRRKLEYPESPSLIHTIRGVGFTLSDQAQ